MRGFIGPARHGTLCPRGLAEECECQGVHPGLYRQARLVLLVVRSAVPLV